MTTALFNPIVDGPGGTPVISITPKLGDQRTYSLRVRKRDDGDEFVSAYHPDGEQYLFGKDLHQWAYANLKNGEIIEANCKLALLNGGHRWFITKIINPDQFETSNQIDEVDAETRPDEFTISPESPPDNHPAWNPSGAEQHLANRSLLAMSKLLNRMAQKGSLDQDDLLLLSEAMLSNAQIAVMK